MGMGTRVVDDDVLEEELNIERTPEGYVVFGEEGQPRSRFYFDSESAEAFMEGWIAAMDRMENMS